MVADVLVMVEVWELLLLLHIAFKCPNQTPVLMLLKCQIDISPLAHFALCANVAVMCEKFHRCFSYSRIRLLSVQRYRQTFLVSPLRRPAVWCCFV